MCGLIGSSFHPKLNPDRLIDLLKHRGPDFSDFKYIDNIFLAHNRLSIIDANNSNANQPMIFDDIAIVFNGTIYNYLDLNKNHNLACNTNSDTETVLRLYQKYGTEFLNFLNGGFAFCIYDMKKELFFCARDRYGKKPLFYYQEDGKFIVSSSIKPIIEIIGKTPKLDKVALNQYLQYFVPIDSNTFYQHIKKLPLSHYMIFDLRTKEFKTKKYYKIDTKKEIFDINSATDTIEQDLKNAIMARLIGDGKIATLLSGGIDSSLVSTIYSQINHQKIDTFSVGYDEHKKYDELKFAKIIAKQINSNHHEITVSQKDFIDNLESTLDILEEPHGDSAAIPLHILATTVKKEGFKVLLSGEGSDELFLGYPAYANMQKYHKFAQSLSNEQIEFLSTIASSLQNNTKESEYLIKIARKEPIYSSFGEIFNNNQKARLLNKPHFFKPSNKKGDFTDFMSQTDLEIWLGNALLSKVDKITSHNAIETRTPFLDFNLVNNAYKIDSNLKLGNTSKYIIKQIAQKYLPNEIINRTKKGFSTPFNEWIHSYYKDDILELILTVNKETNLFKPDYIKYIYALSKDGKFRQHLWSLFIFSKWFKKIYL
ncbi:asparagine synthase (glutamine-hydrolyzing) [Arcobacter sp. FWKO B]|uniref:asparagine synthase (glutamine-hydrolyzing) n=1 Tax=Arcobacter sp. FWKO B TaxID=2593672 RepID=UPI0018A40336|nr:asparagine synthase (glutamine-hydrolyzing) [Arcobacter sp. FWKO B]QOG12306.1 asparagine synthase (glutamine-hydrolyzing) [Arcobacter sp. FWKO B]